MKEKKTFIMDKPRYTHTKLETLQSEIKIQQLQNKINILTHENRELKNTNDELEHTIRIGHFYRAQTETQNQNHAVYFLLILFFGIVFKGIQTFYRCV